LAMVQTTLADGYEVTALARRPDRMPISYARDPADSVVYRCWKPMHSVTIAK
jgi:hypothetical protein